MMEAIGENVIPSELRSSENEVSFEELSCQCAYTFQVEDERYVVSPKLLGAAGAPNVVVVAVFEAGELPPELYART